MIIQLVGASHRPFNTLPLLVIGLIGLFSIAFGEPDNLGEIELLEPV